MSLVQYTDVACSFQEARYGVTMMCEALSSRQKKKRRKYSEDILYGNESHFCSINNNVNFLHSQPTCSSENGVALPLI